MTNHAPMISCILPTYNRRRFVAQAIEYFRRQDYANRELMIVDDGTDCVADLVPKDATIHYVRLLTRLTVGAKRNLACREARGDIILHWDDDDWMADWRISYQVAQLLGSSADICGLDRLLYYEPASQRAWEYVYPPAAKTWVAGNTLCYRKSFWQGHPFPEINVAEDARFVWQAERNQVLRLDNPHFIVGLIHGGNVSPKITSGSYWNPRPISDVHELIGDDRRFYEGGAAPKGKALIAASLGVGDILRMTPLVRVLHRQGYEVDVLIEPDYVETVQLLEGAPEIHSVFYRTSAHVTPRQERLSELAGRNYDVAVFSFWAAPLQSLVSARQKTVFDRADWLKSGDSHSVEKIARQLGWQGEMPPPFAVASKRKFDLSPNTVALHAGCKPDWPWKKWHGFDELANLLPDVVLIGTPGDLSNDGTYFQRAFRWPGHVKIYIGELNLPDTAALLSQCAALVSNDSGMMHLGVALGISAFGVFGITSPKREMIPAKNMFPITKGLACEPACREKPWGRSDCEHHLQCLKTLTAQEVYERVKEVLPKNGSSVFLPKKEAPAMQKLGLIYHGHVFDSSGYGNAARAYIYALHNSGVELSVVDLSRHERQVRDPLVESLVGRSLEADFHLFHGIPPIWAREAFRVPNAIAMTVWETDSMPAQWRNTLNHVLEVWLPCDFNVSAFQHQLSKPVFKLPHAMIPVAGASPPESNAALHVNADDFVFYSIFEWQDRKCPLGQLTAYFRAYPEDGPHMFVLKSNPGAVRAAEQTVDEARRQTGSLARVAVHCEAWSEAELDALHRRGDCYVSLHRGEGWCYPLFEAACRGIPVIATAYSGPLEYLSEPAHQLVSYTLTSVQQPYIYYHPRMRWADPDLTEAAQRMLWVYGHRDEARGLAQAVAPALRARYAPETIGEIAKLRLMDLLRRNNPPRWQQYREVARRTPAPPPQPIPAAWYDADYFENGIKSNWEGGYSWSGFQSLFRDTAAFLAAMFPQATSFLDAGCAKGFLVHALREKGREAWGFDISPWAIDHAIEGARSYVKPADAAAVEWDRTVGFTLAFDLLSHLTEEQAVAFLTRARAWTSVGLLATIQTRESGAEDIGGHDPSHITLQSREWWHARFLRAGWRQDGLHEVLQCACQNHPLPSKMGWRIVLYAPA